MVENEVAPLLLPLPPLPVLLPELPELPVLPVLPGEPLVLPALLAAEVLLATLPPLADAAAEGADVFAMLTSVPFGYLYSPVAKSMKVPSAP